MTRQSAYAPPEAHWTIDRRIPVALVLTILLQTSAGIWWAASISKDVSNQAMRQTNLEQRVTAQDAKLERIATLDVEVKALQKSVQKLDGTIERAIERLAPLGTRR